MVVRLAKKLTVFVCSLAKNTKLSDRKVLVLDGAPKFKGFNADKYSNRVYAINKGTVSLMESIGAWNTIVNTRCQPVKQMQVRVNNNNSIYLNLLISQSRSSLGVGRLF